MNKKQKIAVGIGIIALIVGVTTLVVVSKRTTAPASNTISQLEQSEDDMDIIPTAGPAVIVRLESVQPKKEVRLVVEGIPKGTKTIEYELTYSTKEQESEGVFSTAKPEKGLTTFGSIFEREITLGTCSRNVCRYHDITSDIRVILKFEGSYGAQLFQKGFDTLNL